jgi:MFS family permease
MRDFVSKVTFGFLMAQFVPGAVLVYSIAFLVTALGADPSLSSSQVAEVALKALSERLGYFVTAGLCVGAGMLLHGLNWAVLGFLESRREHLPPGRDSVVHAWYHDRLPIVLQVILGGLIALLEILCFLVCARRVEAAVIEENVPHIPSDKMDAFRFLQDFYLYFAQFFSHTSYALTTAAILYLAYGITFSRLPVILGGLLAFWLSAGAFFVLGRIQFRTLFKAERELKDPGRKAGDGAEKG